MTLRALPALALFIALTHSSLALAADFEFSNPTPLSNPTAGLFDSVYHLGQAVPFDPSASPAAITAAAAYAATNAPNYTFLNTATTFNYNAGNISPTDEVPTAIYLGADASGVAAADGTPIETSIFDAMGYIHISAAGTYTFDSSTADDAVRIYLGGNGAPGSGTSIFERNYMFFSNPPTDYTGPISVLFDSAGYYPIEVLHYNEYSGGTGFAGLSLSVTPDGMLPAVGYAVPEPASLGIFALAVTPALIRRRR